MLQNCRFVVLCRSHVVQSAFFFFTDMREASRRLNQSLFDSYETDWAGEEDLGAIVEVSMIIRAATTAHICAAKYTHTHRQGTKKPTSSLYT